MFLIAIGRLRDTPEAALFDRYQTRLDRGLSVIELPPARGQGLEIKRKEAAALLAALPRRAFTVALDQGGDMLDSQALAAKLSQWLQLGRPVCFIIGGTEGLDASALARADFVLSLGSMTWPHSLARVMLAEQLYRARSIAAGHPYHRHGRPSG